MEQEAKKVYRPIPCPAWDIAGTERWLADMSDRGLHLCGEGFFLGFAAFERGPRRHVRYRLSAAPKQPGFFSDHREPSGEEREIAGSLGWEFLDYRGQFYLWRCTDPEAPELNTDTFVQALALDKAVSRELSGFVSTLILGALFLLRTLFEFGLVTLLLGFGGTYFAFFLLVFALLVVSDLGWVPLRRQRKQLRRLGTLPPARDWRRGRWVYWTRQLLLGLGTALLLLLLFTGWSADMTGKDRHPLEEFPGDPPFATMADFMEGSYRTKDYGVTGANSYEERSGLLAPRVIHWDETARVAGEAGCLSGGLEVWYYETAAPWLARQLVREFQWSRGPWRDRGEWLELTVDLEADYAAAFLDRSTYFPCLVIRKENTVLCARFYQTGEKTLSPDQWAAFLAESLG